MPPVSQSLEHPNYNSEGHEFISHLEHRIFPEPFGLRILLLPTYWTRKYHEKLEVYIFELLLSIVTFC